MIGRIRGHPKFLERRLQGKDSATLNGEAGKRFYEVRNQFDLLRVSFLEGWEGGDFQGASGLGTWGRQVSLAYLEVQDVVGMTGHQERDSRLS